MISRENYESYNASSTVYAFCAIVGAAAGFAVGYAFYEYLPVAAAAAIACAFTSIRIYREMRAERRKRRLLLQFRDMLESLSVSLGAGANIRSAFRSAEEDMEAQYGGASDILRELRTIHAGLDANENIEQLLSDFGARSGLEDIRSFACVFETCFRRGGNIREIVQLTCAVIGDKIDIRQEIRTVVSAKKTEQNAMLVMPVVFVVLLKAAGAGMSDPASPTGIAATSIAVVLFAVSYLLGKKILQIEL